MDTKSLHGYAVEEFPTANGPADYPSSEPQEVVQHVEKRLTLADRIESRYLKVKARVDKLTQSIQAKAFRGELVPQDSNDEPASELLNRSKAEKYDHNHPKAGKREQRLRHSLFYCFNSIQV